MFRDLIKDAIDSNSNPERIPGDTSLDYLPTNRETMSLRRQLDSVRSLPDLRRPLRVLLIAMACLWFLNSGRAFAGDRYEASLAAEEVPFFESEIVRDPIRSKPRPWFLEPSDVVTDSFGVIEPGHCENCCRRCQHGRTRSPVHQFSPNRCKECRPYHCSRSPFGGQRSEALDPDDLTCRVCPIHDSNRLCFFDDIHELPKRWGTDVRALTTCENAIFLGAFGAAAAIMRNNLDVRVAENIQQHGPYGGDFSNTLSNMGDSFTVQIPLIAGVYATSLYFQDDDLHELALTMFASFKFSVIGSLGLQYITGTHRSGGGTLDSFSDSGFPSTPVATSFALAAVIDERYGWRGGAPAYLAAGLIGWAEIDQNQHRVSDVVFGAALGYVIGKSLGSLHYRPNSPCKLVPFIDAVTGTQGVCFERRY